MNKKKGFTMFMNKKKGFTLIELLLVIVLVISLLGLAIFSVTKITKKQKENQYEKVKDTVISAAENYFDVNEYYFDMLEEGGSSIISVDELVRYDYLNVVTDPRTGKKLNKCDRVQVTKNDGKYSFKYVTSDDPDCERKTPDIVIIEPGAPEIYIDKLGSMGTNDWYIDSVKIKVTGQNVGNGNVVEVGKCSDEGCISASDYWTSTTYEDSKTYENSINETDSWYYVKNNYGKKAIAMVSIKVDKDKPTCNLKAEGTKMGEWYTSNVKIKLEDEKDNGPSGLSGEYGINQSAVFYNSKKNDLLVNYDTNGETYYGHVKDKAGNTGYCTKDIKISKTGPSCPSNLFTYADVIAGKNSYCDSSKSTENYHCTSVKVTLNNIPSSWESYTFDGETNTTSKIYENAGEHTPKIIAKDKIGRTAVCSGSKFVIDKTRPANIKVTNTPIICEVKPQKNDETKKQNLTNALRTIEEDNGAKCDAKFSYVSGAFNGKLEKFVYKENGNIDYSKLGSFWLYLAFESSDNESGLFVNKINNYFKGTYWESKWYMYDKNGNSTTFCSFRNKNYPCDWKQVTRVYDKAGNFTEHTVTYKGIKYKD